MPNRKWACAQTGTIRTTVMAILGNEANLHHKCHGNPSTLCVCVCVCVWRPNHPFSHFCDNLGTTSDMVKTLNRKSTAHDWDKFCDVFIEE